MVQNTADSSPKDRSLLQRIVDRLITRIQKLPPPANDYTITRDLRIPMRDGVVLLADIYTPKGQISGTVLVRSPYGWNMLVASLAGSVYASRGYRMILARCRGTFGSGGKFEPMMHETEDGADTVVWMREQPWFDGSFATFGGSYLGFTQWALLMDPPPELKTAVIMIAPHDFYRAIYRKDAFNLDDILGWAYQVAHQEDPFLRKIWCMFTSRQRVLAATAKLPLVEAAENLLQGRSSWYRDWVSSRDSNDPFWSPMKLSDALEKVQVPILLQNGWQDIFLDQTFEEYARLVERGINVGLTIGPWTHHQILTMGKDLPVRETLAWLDEHLVGNGLRGRAKAVKVFVTGAKQWCDFAVWPPATADQVLFPQVGGGLSNQSAQNKSEASFTYDPYKPTPTIGGPILLGGGYTDDSALATRQDTICFTGQVLTAPLEVFGRPVVELSHHTDNPHADLFVRLSEVSSEGSSTNVSEGFVRLGQEGANGVIRIEMDAIAHCFAKGSRIRLIIAGGSHPHWERNLGAGKDPATSVKMVPSRRKIDLGLSRLIIPVLI